MEISGMHKNIPPRVKDAVDLLLKGCGLSIDALLADAKTEKPNQNQKGGTESMRFLSVNDSVRFTSLSRSSLYRAVQAGELHPVKMNPGRTGKVLFRISDLEAWLLGKQQAKPQEAV